MTFSALQWRQLMKIMFAEIAFEVPKSIGAEVFTYIVPEKFAEQIVVGKKVVVPFGRAKRRGIVVGLTDTYVGKYALKSIIHVSNKLPMMSEEYVRLAFFIANYYHASLIKVLKLFIPDTVLNGSEKLPVKWYISMDGNYDENLLKRAPKQQEFIRSLQENLNKTKQKSINLELLNTSIPKQTVRALEKKGIISIEEKIEFSSPTFAVKERKYNSKVVLSEAQKDVINDILGKSTESAEKGFSSKTFLIHGITGSGKTEIYMEIIKKMLEQGKGAIILVPEIALTPQTIQRFKVKFPGILAVWHHKLSNTEKYYEWMRMRNGEAKVLIGSRSALFQPIQDLGVIIMDEEHEMSYKQDNDPRYHARDVAKKLCEFTGASLILGSATPNITSYFEAQEGRAHLYSLDERFSETGLPPVSIVDMRNELKNHNYSMFSKQLQMEIGRTLEQKNQAILFINRRGAASAILCRNCGWKAVCPRCDIVMTMHRKGQIVGKESLLCHYCGFTMNVPEKCPECGSRALKPLGGGTQKVMQELAFMFPKARLLRADKDTTSGKDALGQIYNSFKNHEADILIGTQMIAKGWDIPNVRLVGIILADIGLNMPDFMAEERIFSVLTQVGGRAGRDKIPGTVILQTYSPDDPTFSYVEQHDFRGFYGREIQKRQDYKYPPFVHLAKITFVHANLELVKAKMNGLKIFAENIIKQKKLEVELLGPAPNTIPKIYHKFHYHILLKANEISQLQELINSLSLNEFRVDIDPIGF